MHLKRFFNIHTILLLLVLLTVIAIVIRFLNWGVRINIEDFESDYTEEYSDTLDMFLDVVDAEGNPIRDNDGITTIVCFGNAPFADDRSAKDNLANMIAQRTGATVYNCSVGASFLSSELPTPYFDKAPLDFFSFYWLTQVAAKADFKDFWNDASTAMGDSMPSEYQEVYDTLKNLDFNTVDVVAVMYDASDYLAGRPMYRDDNSTDITCFTGNLEAGIELLRDNYPHIRFIVMSPAYAYAVDETGSYVSSDKYTYGWDVLSTYAIKEAQSCMDQGVTFIDHIYGTINEDNADQYLTDNLHLNAAGRRQVADRFIKALQYFDE